MHHSFDNSNPLLPTWFRASLIAFVTIMLCSCQSALRVSHSDATPMTPLDPVMQERVARFDAILSSTPPQTKTPVRVVAYKPPVDRPAEREAQSLACSPTDATAPRLATHCPLNGCEGARQGNCDSSGPTSGSTCGCGPCAVRGPSDEYLCDGGDCGLPVGVRSDWTIDGLEQEDTIAHYDTVDGRVIVTPSNRVCIYAPRFAAVRRVVNASESLQKQLVNVYEDDMALGYAKREDLAATSLQQLPPVTKIGENPASLLINRQQAGELEARVVVRELKGLIKPYCNLQVVKLGLVDNAEKPWLAKAIVSALTWTGDQAVQVVIEAKAASVLVGSVAPGVVYADEEGKPCLRLIKLASTDHAQPGDEISFTLRFDNIGSQEIGNVTIVDNLTTRLAYVPDSAEASVEADISTSENGAGSVIIRWEIKKPVKAGEGGVLQFRAKVR